MKTLNAVKVECENQLKKASIDSASLDARILISHVLNIKSIEYALEPNRPVSDDEYKSIIDLINLRISRKPISQIVGYKEFWSLLFKVTKDTLTPRPDSETLIEVCLKELKNTNENLRVLDLGTGTGCLLLTLLSELPNATGLGVDISKAAIEVAQENAQRLGLSERAEFKVSNWAYDIDSEELFDIIICNPPYISFSERENLSSDVKDFEPEKALFSGNDGLNDYKIIAKQISKHIKPHSIMIFEIGHTQAQKVNKIFISEGFNKVSIHQDLGQRDRCMVIKQ